MDTYEVELVLEVDREEWAKFAGGEATREEVVAWVVEVLEVSQGHASGAVMARTVR